MSKIKYPVIVVAQDLREGHVVFVGSQGLTRDWREAVVAATPEAGEALLARARIDEAANSIVGAELVEVEQRAEGIRPIHYRERFRVYGFGRQDSAFTDAAE
ncbi:MAG: DUF2849 domain-containing protein [Hyphomicrobiaceae bacterium]|nr:DUF2849 domain-containing protein [Hyphomicrobiaceae bacterium]